ncbi:tkl protein kinase [Plasmopara halstedii]|uniref:Tkl protein kinase n=1 Tax=Plasmopara halstedii TaxID=4781 RepID=A0A0P1ASA2_PLAHL|nr:tkl protein kinase [Plasmopara halstedii]CEG44570.1 tkl protein kinase [Plasmopara halstedii]|eukprot:XP_024580939.1 tkl protein kinase [Plasmopara halstedii]
MVNCIPRQQCKWPLSTALTLCHNLLALAISSNSDILTRCENLESEFKVITKPSDIEVPNEVLVTLSTHSNTSWNELNDATKVGLLWVHGYVFSGGFDNGDKAGDTILPVYTRCSNGSAIGVEMAKIGVLYDDFTAQCVTTQFQESSVRPVVDHAKVEEFLAAAKILPLTLQSEILYGGRNTTLFLGAIMAGIFMLIMTVVIGYWCHSRIMGNAEPIVEIGATQSAGFISIGQSPDTSRAQPLGFISWVIGRHVTTNNLSTANIHAIAQSTRGRLSSWYTFGNASNCESQQSSTVGTWFGAEAGGKSVSEYCDESEELTTFLQHPEVLSKCIAFDQLTFLSLLSKGAYGEVWLGQFNTQRVAIKRLLPEKCQLTSSLEQFAGEIQLMCMLQHRNIVSFEGLSWNRLQNLCAVLEYMEAGDLDAVLKQNRDCFSWQQEKISIAMDIAEGLVYLHCLRPVIVHRDLKSKNVLLNEKMHAKLSDFGVSRKTFINETMTSGVGTLLWTAPEIIEGKKYSEKADVYSLGVVLSEMDTCESPFSDVISEKGGRLPGMQLAHFVRLGNIRVSLRDDCPTILRKLIMDCTQLDPDARPSSMQVAYTLKSIIAPALRMSSSTLVTTSISTYPSFDALQRKT